jgi:hypothetical protein
MRVVKRFSVCGESIQGKISNTREPFTPSKLES